MTVQDTATTATVVVVDDEDLVREVVSDYLTRDGFRVLVAGDGVQAHALLQRERPQLAIIDVMLPGRDGLSLVRELRTAGSVLPIILLTAKTDEVDRIVGLELGADDYVTKPFSVREMVARVKALLRRTERDKDKTEPEEVLTIGALTIDPSSYRVQRNGEAVQLTALEFRLLYFLASRPNRVFSRDQLLDAVWGTERFVTPRSVDVYIRRLREKVEVDPVKPALLKTMRGAGYLFETVAS